MKPEDIKRGHFYRYRGGLTIYLITKLGEHAGAPVAEVMILQHGHVASAEQKTMSFASLCVELSGEVRPNWIDIADGGPEIRYDTTKVRPDKVPGQCQVRQYHMFPSSDPGAKCDDCGITVAAAIEAQQERLAAEEMAKGERLSAEAMAKQEPAPEPAPDAGAWLASLTGDR